MQFFLRLPGMYAKHNFVKENVGFKNIVISQVTTNDMIADPLTKPAPALRFNRFIVDAGLVLLSK